MKTVIEIAHLPNPYWVDQFIDFYTADQMQEYAKKAVEIEREACAKVCETQDGAGPAYENWWEFSAAIRARGNT